MLVGDLVGARRSENWVVGRPVGIKEGVAIIIKNTANLGARRILLFSANFM